MAEESTPKVTYWAISVLNSKTAWMAVLTIITGLLALPEVVAIVPLRFLPIITMIVGVANFCLRLVTERPVAFIAPGTSKPVEVEKIAPPPPPTLAD